MDNCKTCANASFNSTWGEYQCLKLKRKISDINKRANCELYKKGTPKERTQDERAMR